MIDNRIVDLVAANTYQLIYLQPFVEQTSDEDKTKRKGHKDIEYKDIIVSSFTRLIHGKPCYASW